MSREWIHYYPIYVPGRGQAKTMKRVVLMVMLWGLVTAPMLASAGDVCVGKSASAIREATIEDGEVLITRCDGAMVRPPMLENQTGVDKLLVSPDHKTAGWAVLEKNCCTSYDIPTRLVVYYQEKFMTLMPPHSPQMIWDWEFKRGAEIVMRSGPTHGNMCVNSVHDVHTGKKVREKDCVDGK